MTGGDVGSGQQDRQAGDAIDRDQQAVAGSGRCRGRSDADIDVALQLGGVEPAVAVGILGDGDGGARRGRRSSASRCRWRCWKDCRPGRRPGRRLRCGCRWPGHRGRSAHGGRRCRLARGRCCASHCPVTRTVSRSPAMASGGRSMRMSILPLSSARLMKPSSLASSMMVTARPCRLLVSNLGAVLAGKGVVAGWIDDGGADDKSVAPATGNREVGQGHDRPPCSRRSMNDFTGWCCRR